MMLNASEMACSKLFWLGGNERLWKIFGPIVEKKQG